MAMQSRFKKCSTSLRPHVVSQHNPDVMVPHTQGMADGSSEMIRTKKRMPTFVPTKEIHPLSKRRQYVSKRHRESLKEFKSWRKREDVQERMKALRLLDPSKQLEVYDYLEN